MATVLHEDAPQLTLRDHLRVLQRRRTLIAVITLGVVAVALGATFLQAPTYRANAALLLQPAAEQSLFSNGVAPADAARSVQNQIRVLRSDPVRVAAIAKIPPAQQGTTDELKATRVTLVSDGDTDVVKVIAEGPNRELAAALVNAYLDAYIELRRAQVVDSLASAGSGLQAKVDDLAREIDRLDAQVTEVPASQAEAVRQRIAPRRQTLTGQQDLLQRKLDELQADVAVRSGGVQVVSRAKVPPTPFKPAPKRALLVALPVGLLFGVGIAFLIDHLNDAIRGKDDVERLTPGIPVLALIPDTGGSRARSRSSIVALTQPRSRAAEAYKGLRTSVQLKGPERSVRVIQVTSPDTDEARVATLANLAVTLAQAGQRVIVVCCDLRRPLIHEFFGLSNAVGLTSVLAGEVPLSAALQPVASQERLLVLGSGPPPAKPAELLSSSHTADLLSAVQAYADVVLIDSPPVLPVTDAVILANHVDATILVLRVGTTTRTRLERTVELLDQVEGELLGTVLHGVDDEPAYGRLRYGPSSNGRGGLRRRELSRR